MAMPVPDSDTLTEGAGGGFNTWGVPKFGMAGSFAVKLAKIFQVIKTECRIRARCNVSVKQHRGMTTGEDEAVAARASRD